MKLALTAIAATLLLAPALRAQEPAPNDRAPVADQPFVDVPPDHWAYPAVEELRKKGILRGYPAPAGGRTFNTPEPARKPAPEAARATRKPRLRSGRSPRR